MVDDSELDYIRTFFSICHLASIVKHFSEFRNIALVGDSSSRILVFPSELLNTDGKFYTKRYMIKLSEESEADMTETVNDIINSIDLYNKGLFTGTYTGTNFYIGDEDITPVGITTNTRDILWVLGNNNKAIYRYNAAGVYQSVTFDVSGEDIDPQDIYWDDWNLRLWVVGNNTDEVYQYNAAGNYTSTHFDTSSEDGTPVSITGDGTVTTDLYVGGASNDAIYTYNLAGVYQSESIDVSNEISNPAGICWDGTHFWVLGGDTKNIYRYTSAGVYTGINFSVGSEDAAPTGICWHDGGIWMVGDATNTAYYYKIYLRNSTLLNLNLAYGNKAYEHPKTKRWYQDLYIDVEWCTE